MTIGRRPRSAVVVALAAVGLAAGLTVWLRHRSGGPPVPADRVEMDALPGFALDDPVAVVTVFRRSCAVRHESRLDPACRRLPPDPVSAERAVTYLRETFDVFRLRERAFFTGYYEPVVPASLSPTPAFRVPLLAPPPGLVDVTPGRVAGLDPTLSAAVKGSDGVLRAMPDRAAIETGKLATKPVAYVASRVEAFFIQIQGSARLRLPDGQLRRLVYAGRNGYPYSAIGKTLASRLNLPPAQVTMGFLKAWIAAHGEGDTDEGTALMRSNRSFIFFHLDADAPPSLGPPGGSGARLTPERSLAIDHHIWPYGLPFYVETQQPAGLPFRRLMVGQDTGAAIQGPARGDIFFGTGDEAAGAAGAMRAPGTLTVFWPKDGQP